MPLVNLRAAGYVQRAANMFRSGSTADEVEDWIRLRTTGESENTIRAVQQEAYNAFQAGVQMQEHGEDYTISRSLIPGARTGASLIYYVITATLYNQQAGRSEGVTFEFNSPTPLSRRTLGELTQQRVDALAAVQQRAGRRNYQDYQTGVSNLQVTSIVRI